MTSLNAVEAIDGLKSGPSQEQKRGERDAQAQDPEPKINDAPKPEKTCMFAAIFGDGTKPEGVSRAVFMSKAARAAIMDLKKVGTFRRTSGGQLFHCLEKPKPRVVVIVADDIRMKTLINAKFNINAASRDVFGHIVTAMQMECFENGLVAEVHQFCHVTRCACSSKSGQF